MNGNRWLEGERWWEGAERGGCGTPEQDERTKRNKPSQESSQDKSERQIEKGDNQWTLPRSTLTEEREQLTEDLS